MIAPQTYVTFSPPVVLNLRVSQSQRLRVTSPKTETAPVSKSFDRLPLVISIDAVRRYILATLPPASSPLVLYGPTDFAAACADTMDDHAQRVIDLCGSDPASVLQPLVDGSAPAYFDRPDPPAMVPREIPNWRAKAVLATMGLTSQVQSVIEALPEPQRTIIRTAWDGDAKFARKSPTIAALAGALNLSASDVDGIFVSAMKIEV